MDDVDITAMRMEEELAALLAARASRPEEHSMTPRGSCYYCYEELNDDELFCDSECLQEYRAEQLILSRQRGGMK